MALKTAILVVLILIQMHFASTRSTRTKCTDCDILKRLQKRSRADALSNDNLVGQRRLLSNTEDSNLNDMARNFRSVSDTTEGSTKTVLFEATELVTVGPSSASGTFASTQLTPTEQTTSRSITIQSSTIVTTSSQVITSDKHSATVQITSVSHNPSTAVPIGTFFSTQSTLATFDSSETSTDPNPITESPTNSNKRLGLILGLTLGLALPVSLGLIGGLIYFFKVYRPNHSQILVATY